MTRKFEVRRISAVELYVISGLLTGMLHTGLYLSWLGFMYQASGSFMGLYFTHITGLVVLLKVLVVWENVFFLIQQGVIVVAHQSSINCTSEYTKCKYISAFCHKNIRTLNK